jgi:Mrr restriction endonuclease-like protein
MAAIPNKRAVSQAIRSARRTLKQTIKEINQTAADLAKKGDYERAEAAMTKGRSLMEFREEIAGVEQKWKQVCASGKAQSKASGGVSLAAWQYYAPIVRSLVALGGKASLSDLEAEFLRQMELHLRVGDRSHMAGGRERWQVMIRRARKHMVKEGWLLSRSSKLWEITAAGRQLAEKQGE